MPQPSRRPGRVVRLVLVMFFVVLPILEILTIVAVSRVVGGWWTLLLILLGSLVGAWVVKRQGRRSWLALRQAAQDVPLQPGAIGDRPRQQVRPLADGALVLAGGALLMVPGFLTDLLGLLFILPVTRPLARVTLAYVIGRRVTGTVERFGAHMQGPGGPSGPSRAGGATVRGDVVE